MGEVVIADNTVTGEGIVMAQRLEQLAESGGVCVQSAAYETMPKRLPFSYTNLGTDLLHLVMNMLLLKLHMRISILPRLNHSIQT